MQPYYQHAGIQIYHAPYADVLPQLDGDYMIVTDPSYGTGGWRRTATGMGSNPAGTLVVEPWDDGSLEWLRLVRTDVIATFWPSCHARHLLPAAYDLGFTKHRTLYMRKRDPKPQVAGRIRWSVEPIWVLSREGFVLVGGDGGDDCYEASTPRKGRDHDATGHPYQKPLAVMRWILSKLPARRVVDPSMGSGTTLVAAKEAGLPAIGIDQDEWCCEQAARRLSQEVMPLEVA